MPANRSRAAAEFSSLSKRAAVIQDVYKAKKEDEVQREKMKDCVMYQPVSEWEESDKRPPGRKKFFAPLGRRWEEIDWTSA